MRLDFTDINGKAPPTRKPAISSRQYSRKATYESAARMQAAGLGRYLCNAERMILAHGDFSDGD